jgi:pimeloyl-ACP methyl ester carboxylesterase
MSRAEPQSSGPKVAAPRRGAAGAGRIRANRGGYRGLLLLAALCAPLLIGAAPPAPAGASGHWEGTIDIPGTALQVKVDLTVTAGAWSGSIDIPAQNAKGLPLEDVTAAGGQVHFLIRGVPGAPAFDGSLAAGEIRGTFRQGGASFPFHLGREPLVPPRRPQEPRPPFPYEQREAAYDNGTIHLAGTLTLPPGPGPFPAALLITGSGAQDRDEQVMGHRPFLVIADHLTRAGIAVLRVDDRGVGGSTGDNDSSTEDDFVSDVLAGVRFLAAQPRIDQRRIGLIGHSEGGTIAPLAAGRAPRTAGVAFLVLLAGTGLPGDEIVMRQTEWLLRAAGAPAAVREERLASERQILDLIRAERDPAKLRDRLRPLVEAGLATGLPEEQAANGGSGDAMVRHALRILVSPWYRSFVGYDPRPVLRQVRVPVLALGGDRDFQVPAAENLAAIAAALREDGDRDVTVRVLPGLNHLFQHAVSGGMEEYSAIEETFAPEALDIMTRWILDRFSVTPTPAAVH